MGGLLSKQTSNGPEGAHPAEEKDPKQKCEEKEATKSGTESQHLPPKTEEKEQQSKVIPAEEKTKASTECSSEKEDKAKDGSPGSKDQSPDSTTEHPGDVSLLTEAARNPIPASPYVDQSSVPAAFKGREGLGLGKAPLGPSPLTFEVKEDKEDKSEVHDEPEMKNDDDKKMDQDLIESQGQGQDSCHEEKPIHTEDQAKESTPEKTEAKDQMRTAECQILDDTSVTKDVSVHQEMVLPVEELAEQFSNVVISTAARELQAEQRGGKHPDLVAGLETEQHDEKYPNIDAGLEVDQNDEKHPNIDTGFTAENEQHDGKHQDMETGSEDVKGGKAVNPENIHADHGEKSSKDTKSGDHNHEKSNMEENDLIENN